MTAKEAIEWLNTDDFHSNGFEEATGIAITALEKQIPSKPNHSGFTGQYTCKKCGDAIFGLREGIDWYCPHCGQRQDWSGVAE